MHLQLSMVVDSSASLAMAVFLLAPAATTQHRCSWTLTATHICGPVVGSGTCVGMGWSGGMGRHLMPRSPYAHQDPDQDLARVPAGDHQNLQINSDPDQDVARVPARYHESQPTNPDPDEDVTGA